METNTDERIRQLEASCQRWRAVSLLAFAVALLALVTPIVRGLFGSAFTAPISQPAAATPHFDQLTVGTLKVELLNVVDDKGNTVVSILEGAGGGALMVKSATPDDHVVTIMATPHGADVQVSSQQKPRQFASLKIMDRKPYLQLYQEGATGRAEHFYQAPLYAADGTIGGSAPE